MNSHSGNYATSVPGIVALFVLRFLLYVLAGVTVFSVVLGLGGTYLHVREYTIEELYAETMASAVKPQQIILAAIIKNAGGEGTPVADFLELMKSDPNAFALAINRIRSNWNPGDTIMLVEASSQYERTFPSYRLPA